MRRRKPRELVSISCGRRQAGLTALRIWSSGASSGVTGGGGRRDHGGGHMKDRFDTAGRPATKRSKAVHRLTPAPLHGRYLSRCPRCLTAPDDQTIGVTVCPLRWMVSSAAPPRRLVELLMRAGYRQSPGENNRATHTPASLHQSLSVFAKKCV